MELAFKEARARCPKCKLFYNDYNAEGSKASGQKTYSTIKSDRVYELVKGLLERKTNSDPMPLIDGVGLQMHLKLDRNKRPSIASIRANIERLVDLGLEVHITEADIKIPPTFTADAELEQAKLYAELLNACWEVPKCTAFTTWGFTDAKSWLLDKKDNTGRPKWVSPLPFDKDFQPKLAVEHMISIINGSGVTWESVDR